MNIAPQTIDAATFLASGDRLFQRQRDRMAAEEAAFKRAHFELQMTYEAAMRKMMADHDEAVRALERSYHQARAEDERILSSLSAMREG